MQEEAACSQFAEQLAEERRQLENLHSIIDRCEVDLRQKERQLSEAQDQLECGIRELNGQNELLALSLIHI